MSSVDTHTLFEYARRVQVNRYTVMNIIDRPNARDILAGAFVRLLLQLPSQWDDYVVARVVTIIQGEPYSGFSSDVHRSTRSCLQLELPVQLSEINGTIYQLNSISNSTMQEAEFVRWFTAMRVENGQFSMTVESLQRVYERVHYFETMRSSQQQQQQVQQVQQSTASQPLVSMVAATPSGVVGLSEDSALAGRLSGGVHDLGASQTTMSSSRSATAASQRVRSPATATNQMTHSTNVDNANVPAVVTTTARVSAGQQLARQQLLPSLPISSQQSQHALQQEPPGRCSENSLRTHVAPASASADGVLQGNMHSGSSNHTMNGGSSANTGGNNHNEVQRTDSNWQSSNPSHCHSVGYTNAILTGVGCAVHTTGEDVNRVVGTQLSSISQQHQQHLQSRCAHRSLMQCNLPNRAGHESSSSCAVPAQPVSNAKKSAGYVGMSTEAIDPEKERRMLQNVINTLSQTSVLFPRNVGAMKLTRLAILERDMSEYLQHVRVAVSAQLVVCVVCLDKSSSVVTMPCKHKVLCRLCAPSVRTCPVCRSHIDELFEVEEP